jgi:predicted methyltransferase
MCVRTRFLTMLTASCVLATAAAADQPEVDAAIAAAVASPDRPQADRERDASRRPGEVLAFFGVRPGMKVIEYLATGGFTAEILSRVVGPQGKVYMQNPPSYYERAGTAAVEARLANNRLPNVVRLDVPLASLGLPDDSCDGAVMNLVFHDFFWLSNDVPAILAELHRTLKPGGFVGVVDHAAPAGTGAEYAKNRSGQHRIDEAYVRRMFDDAGFELVKSGDFLRNPADDRQKPFFAPEMSGQVTDRFALLLRKKS